MRQTTIIAGAILAMLLTGGCSDAPPPTGSSPDSIKLLSPAIPPAYLVVTGPDRVRAGETVTVAVTIVRKVSTQAPATLCAHIPAGAALTSGEPCTPIGEGPAGSIMRQYRFRLDAIPAGDLGFELLQGAGSSPLRAEAFYRFGRAEPRLAVPETGQPWLLGGKTIAAPIKMNKPGAGKQ